MYRMPAFVLVHSPLVGPYTWEPVAGELRGRGYEVVLPHLTNSEADGRPYWQQHVEAIAESARSLSPGQTLILAGHSGAGVLLPTAGRSLDAPCRYIFVDSDLPMDGRSRLDRFPPEDAERLRRIASNGYIPPWTDDQLARAIPDPDTRRRFASELAPVPLAVYEEPIPVPPGWPDAPCAYLAFAATGAYGQAISESKSRGWPTVEMPGGHFHLLVDPPAVADALFRLIEE
jgi:hypothetical protein